MAIDQIAIPALGAMSTHGYIPTCKHFRQKSCTSGNACQFRHSGRDHPSSATAIVSACSSQSPCQYFQRGSCQYGINCRNLHVLSAKTYASEARPCAFYARNACSKGSSCTFSHDVPLNKGTQVMRVNEGNAKHTSGSPFGVCKFFSQGRCMKGANCTFPHEPASSPIVSVAPEPASPFLRFKEVRSPLSPHVQVIHEY
jgi:hypothetical protein